MKKVLAISSVLLGVVFLAGCGQQPVSQTQPTTPAPVVQQSTQPAAPTPADETANWQTYTNSRHNYSIKYPKDWSLGDSRTSTTPSSTADDVAFDSPQYTGARFTIQVTSPSDCSNLADCVTKNRKIFSSDQQTTGIANGAINRKSAMLETITRPTPTSGNWKYRVWYVFEGGKLYIFHTISLATDGEATDMTWNKILTTLKFTK